MNSSWSLSRIPTRLTTQSATIFQGTVLRRYVARVVVHYFFGRRNVGTFQLNCVSQLRARIQVQLWFWFESDKAFRLRIRNELGIGIMSVNLVTANYWSLRLVLLMCQVICSLCDHEQDVKQVCENCGVCMGEYFCTKCKFFDDEVSVLSYPDARSCE